MEEGIAEDRVWRQFIRGKLAAHDATTRDLLGYGLTEMVNNAIDHSGGTELVVQFVRTPISAMLRVTDNGVGIFRKITEALGLADSREALLELSKGKFTTDPTRHTGEGVFFTSRSFDCFSIQSGELVFRRSARANEWLVEAQKPHCAGTRVTMSLLDPPRRKLEEVFARYSSGPEDYRFARTDIPLRLAAFGDESLLSRSSARRVLSRIDRFDEATLDFRNVKSIGPAFADEIFRVFALQHPHVQLIAINANEQVTGMIRRAQAARAESAGTPDS